MCINLLVLTRNLDICKIIIYNISANAARKREGISCIKILKGSLQDCWQLQ